MYFNFRNNISIILFKNCLMHPTLEYNQRNVNLYSQNRRGKKKRSMRVKCT